MRKLLIVAVMIAAWTGLQDGEAIAGPAANAQQFQQKAASQAMSRQRDQNFSTNKVRYQDPSPNLVNLGDSYNSDKADDLRLQPDETTPGSK